MSSSDEDNNFGINMSFPSPSLPPTKCKHTKSARPSTSHALRSCHVSAGQGMSEMANSLASMVKVFKTKRAPKTQRAPTPPLTLLHDPLTRAVITLEADRAFSDDKMLDIIEVFMANQTFVAVYATLQTS